MTSWSILLLLATYSARAQSKPAPPANFAYVLQAKTLATSRAQVVERLARCGRDWIVLDAVFNAEPAGAWTESELRKIRAGKAGRKILSYLSIGEMVDSESITHISY